MGRKHTHKYHIVDNYWACARSDCNHYMHKSQEKLLHGKKSICWNCESEFMLDPDNMKMVQPICDECRMASVDQSVRELIESTNKPLIPSGKA